MWITTGTSRKDTKYKKVNLSWSDLTAKLKKPQRTSETLKQYAGLTKEEKGNIKDIGGYVGGTIKGGRRLKEAIECRSLITLEADEDCADLWASFCLAYDCAAFIHATHSSTPENPRLRLIIPLNRECFTTEYEAIIRRVAEDTGITFFDYTSFQPERLMYWPSISKDATYYYEEQKGEFLNVDSVLRTYKDWKDISQWPLHPKENKVVETAKNKQEDPLEKPGIIGAFCRTYTISEAIEQFLSEVYAPADTEDRYTYIHGSTAAGVVVYDDLFSYSHHSTDPANGILCNAFDLVRLSLFGEYDTDIPANVPPGKRPSFMKCCELLLGDGKVKRAIIGDKLKGAKEDFAGIEPISEDNSKEEWFSKLETDNKGRTILSTTNNIVLILENDKWLSGVFKWDAFNYRMILAKDTYWKHIERASDAWIDDNDKANIRHYLEKIYGISGKDKLNDALLITGHKCQFHPVRDYLSTLEWDGVNRLDTLLIDYFGAADTPYTWAVTRKTFTAAVTRVFEPGRKYETMLILVSTEGIGKSTFLRALAGEWFSDNMGNIHDKQGMEQLRGAWIMEVPELAGFKRADIETIKSFLSREADRFRQAYGETLAEFPRQTVFIGSTNEDEPLVGSTGNRRFWPVVLGIQKHTKNAFKVTEAERGQIWAEALYYYRQGESIYLDKRLTKEAAEVQNRHTEQESYLQIIETYLAKQIPANWYELTPSERYSFLQGNGSDFGEKQEVQNLMTRYKVSCLEIWTEAMGGRRDMFKKHEAKSIKNAMRKIPGWEYKQVFIEGINSRGWMRKDD